MSRTGAAAPLVVLASASPRRLDLLRMFGLEPEVKPADVDETPLAGEKPAELVERLARAKAEAVFHDLSSKNRTGAGQGAEPGLEGGPVQALIVAADTVIDLDGQVFGKPVDHDDAADMLRLLSGRAHDVVTGMAVVGRRGGSPAIEAGITRASVWIKTLSEEEIGWYLATGEPMDKAGAYAIQGLGSVLIDRVEGSYQGVVGLSLRALDQLTASFDLPLRCLRPAPASVGAADGGQP